MRPPSPVHQQQYQQQHQQQYQQPQHQQGGYQMQYQMMRQPQQMQQLQMQQQQQQLQQQMQEQYVYAYQPQLQQFMPMPALSPQSQRTSLMAETISRRSPIMQPMPIFQPVPITTRAPLKGSYAAASSYAQQPMMQLVPVLPPQMGQMQPPRPPPSYTPRHQMKTSVPVYASVRSQFTPARPIALSPRARHPPSQQEADGDEVSLHTRSSVMERRRPVSIKPSESGSFKPYTLDSYREMRQRDSSIRLGGLGPPVSSDMWKQSHERKERELLYAEKVRERLYRRHMEYS